MKICFHQQALFTYIGHAMAMHLKEMMPEASFCAFAQLRSGHTFLTQQTDINYGAHIPLEEDLYLRGKDAELDLEFLRSFEKEYGIPNLWPYLYLDRVIMNGQYLREYPYDKPLLSYDGMLKHVQENAKEVLAFLEKEKPDAIIFSVIGSTASFLLYSIAKKKGIQTLILKGTRIGKGMTCTEVYRTLDTVARRFRERNENNIPPLDEARQFIDGFRERPTPYFAQALPTFNKQAYRSGNLRFLAPMRLMHSIVWHGKELYNDLTLARDYNQIRIWWKMWDKLKRKLRGLRGYQKFYSLPNSEDRFAYYPLHLEPETALLLDSPYHTDQLELIRAAAHALPIDMVLYVKEHPQMVGYRTRTYYRELTKIPNVRLIDPRIVGTDLVKKASLVFTITGTGGFESVLFGKPVITFTEVYYNDLSLVTMCRDFDRLPYVVQEQLEKQTASTDEIEHYVSALMEESVPVNYGELWVSGLPASEIAKDETLRDFSALIVRRLTSAS